MWLFSKATVLLVIVASAISAASGARIRKNDNPTGRDIHIVNDSDVKVDVFWVHPQTGEKVKSVDVGILKGTDSQINSYIGHEFEVQELPRKTTGLCRGENDECRTARFVVTSNEDQRFTILKDITIKYEDARTRAMDKAKQVSEECPMPELTEENGIPDLDQWAECLQQKINATLDDSKQEIEFQAGIRKNMGRKLVDYACKDEEFPSATSIFNQTLNLGLGRQRNPEMRYLFESDTSKIVLIENFVARSQCKWLIESARKTSDKLDWSAINDVAIRTVVERIYKALEQILEYTEDGGFLDQQSRMSHTYPLFELHTSNAADGNSEGKRFLAEEDERPLMATFMLFCDIPDKGGAIHFPKAGIHVRPQAGQALLVTYMDPKTGERHDDAYTSEHVECPVAEGKQTALKYHIADS